MHRPRKADRRGAIAVLAAVLMMALIVMIAFAIDTGYVAHIRTEMQLAADAAAFAGVNALAFDSPVNAAALQAAEWNNNDDVRGVILSTDDVDIGYWDRDTATFTTPAPFGEDDNAVRATVRRTEATGNPANLFFMAIFGTSQTDVTATATAMYERSPCGPLVGIDYVWAPGGAITDSYHSSEGSYNAGTAGKRGSLCSDGPIDITGNVAINGDANAGKGHKTSIGGSGVVTGNKKPRSKPLVMPGVDASAAAATNNNANFPPGRLDAEGNLEVGSGETLTLNSGTYYLNDLKVRGQATLNFKGKVVIYLTGDLNTAGGELVNGTLVNGTRIPGNLQIYMTGGTANITANVDFYGAIYAPNTDVTIQGSGDLFGAIVGKTLTMRGDGAIHYDEDMELENDDELTPRTALVE